METRTITLYKFADLPLPVQCRLLDKRFQYTKSNITKECYNREHLSKYLLEAGFYCHHYSGSYSISLQSAKNQSDKIKDIAEKVLKSGDAALVSYHVNVDKWTMTPAVSPDNFNADRYRRITELWKSQKEIEEELFRLLREAFDAADKVPSYPSREQMYQRMIKEPFLYFANGEEVIRKTAEQLGITL